MHKMIIAAVGLIALAASGPAVARGGGEAGDLQAARLNTRCRCGRAGSRLRWLARLLGSDLVRRAVEQLVTRLTLARDGYALVKCELGVFNPES